MPKTRREDAEFRAWAADHVPDWQEVERHSGRKKDDSDLVWWAFPWPTPSDEGYRLCWFRSSQKIAQDATRRSDHLHRAIKEFSDLSTRLSSPCSRFRDRVAVEQAADAILARTDTAGLISYTVSVTTEEHFRQV